MATDPLIKDISERMTEDGARAIKCRIPVYKADMRKTAFIYIVMSILSIVLIASVCALFLSAGYGDLFTVDDAVNVWGIYTGILVGEYLGVRSFKKHLIKSATVGVIEV